MASNPPREYILPLTYIHALILGFSCLFQCGHTAKFLLVALPRNPGQGVKVFIMGLGYNYLHPLLQQVMLEGSASEYEDNVMGTYFTCVLAQCASNVTLRYLKANENSPTLNPF